MISHDTFNEHVLGIIISSSWVIRQSKRDISVDKCRGAGNSASSQPSGLADERGYTRPSYCCGRMRRYEWADAGIMDACQRSQLPKTGRQCALLAGGLA